MEHELYHYGIKRRSGRYPYGSGERPYQGEPTMQKSSWLVKKQRANDIKRVRTLSDGELRKKIDRLKLEQELKNLTTKDLSPAKKEVTKVLATTAKSTFTVVSANLMPYMTTRLLQGKAPSAQDFGNYLAQKIGLKDPVSKISQVAKSSAPTQAQNQSKDKKTEEKRNENTKKEESKSKSENKESKKDYSSYLNSLIKKSDSTDYSAYLKSLEYDDKKAEEGYNKSKADYDKISKEVDAAAKSVDSWLSNYYSASAKFAYDKVNKETDDILKELEDWTKKHT